MVLGNMLMGFVVILVGVVLMPSVADSTTAATVGTNVTGAAATVTNLVILFFALGVMTTGVAMAMQGLREAGLV